MSCVLCISQGQADSIGSLSRDFSGVRRRIDWKKTGHDTLRVIIIPRDHGFCYQDIRSETNDFGLVRTFRAFQW